MGYNWEEDLQLLQDLVAIPGLSGDESAIAAFVIDYVKKNSSAWKTKPRIYSGGGYQDAIILVFGSPKTAMYTHMDTIGFHVSYDNKLVKSGGPKAIDGLQLVGIDVKGPVACELMVIEEPDGNYHFQGVTSRKIERGTALTFKPNFRKTKTYIQSPYLDNRLGVWVALMTARNLTDGAIVFSTYEEHGGGSVGFLGKKLYEDYQVRQALICDITWKTEGVKHGKGVAISMRDSGIPRRSYLNKVIDHALRSKVPFQLEVESAGGSDGQALQRSSYPIDWVFVGAPEDNVHTPDEKVHLADIDSMLRMYTWLMLEMNK